MPSIGRPLPNEAKAVALVFMDLNPVLAFNRCDRYRWRLDTTRNARMNCDSGS
jgi:hypothetical protein